MERTGVRRVPVRLLAAIAPVVLLLPIALGADKPAADDPMRIAEKLVRECAGVGENDKVIISGGTRDLELLEDIAVQTRKMGAHPLITIGSDRMTRMMYDDVPYRYDSQTPALAMDLAGIASVMISVDFGESDDVLAGVPADRLAATGQAAAPVGRKMSERCVRQVNLGNSLYPTEQRAERYQLTREQLADIFWSGVNVDYTKLQERGQKLQAMLAAGSELKIKNPNGTDFTVRIQGRPVLVSDGVISAEERRAGGSACQTWLPAGEVYLAPVPGTAEGKIVVDRHYFQGEKIKNLKLIFSEGRLVSMTADTGIEKLRALYDASGEGKDLFGVVDIGINPKVVSPPDSRLDAWMESGMITIGIGNNTWAGGDNDVSFALYPYLPGSTVKIDGKAVVDDGKLDL